MGFTNTSALYHEVLKAPDQPLKDLGMAADWFSLPYVINDSGWVAGCTDMFSGVLAWMPSYGPPPAARKTSINWW